MALVFDIIFSLINIIGVLYIVFGHKRFVINLFFK